MSTDHGQMPTCPVAYISSCSIKVIKIFMSLLKFEAYMGFYYSQNFHPFNNAHFRVPPPFFFFFTFFWEFHAFIQVFLLCSTHSFPQFLDISLRSVALLKKLFFLFSLKKNNLHSIFYCIYNHGCEVISCSVLYLPGAEPTKENISPSLEHTNWQNSSTDRGGTAQELLTPTHAGLWLMYLLWVMHRNYNSHVRELSILESLSLI